MIRFILAAVTAALLGAAPYAASAQSYDPSYANAGGGDAQIRGRIVNFDGGYNLQVRDDQGYVDNVQLHQGTIINPTGLTLAPGMTVSVLGYNAGPYFAANEVDTPYTYVGAVPYYGGHPWNYWGPSVSLGFFFGNAGWWHGSAFAGGYRYVGGVRVYNNVQVSRVYQGGSYNGRTYVAPASRGGYVPRTTTVHAAYQGGGQAYHGGAQPVQGGGQAYHGGGQAYHGGGSTYHGGGGEHH